MASFLNPRPNFPTQSAILVLIWIGLFCVAEINAGRDVGGVLEKGAREQRELDFFVLALNWPVTYCHRSDICCPSNACCGGSNALKRFTINGLWPDYNNGSWPSCCSGTEFDPKEISTLLDDLNKYWPPLSCSPPLNCNGVAGSFLEYEWGTHGTCASPVLEGEYQFFATALNLYSRYNVTEVLTEAGYIPSHNVKYPAGAIISTIQNAFDLTPVLRCSGYYVEGLHLCFDKTFKPRDCLFDGKKSCPEYVTLPDYISSSTGNYVTEAAHSTLQYLLE